jgi:TIR domain
MCYATEDSERVATLERVLTVNRIQVWRSASSLEPGDDWAAEIRNAIQHESIAFLACFSTKSIVRTASYQRTELLLAIDELRSRQPGTSWLIPVRLDDCEVPDLDIGGGRTLAGIHRADLFGPQLKQNTDRLVARIKEICHRQPEPESEPEPEAEQAEADEPATSTTGPAKPGWLTALDAFDQTYQHCVGWLGTMISPVAMSAVLHLGTDPGTAAVYLSRVPVPRAARMLAAAPPAMAGEVLKRMKETRRTAVLDSIPATIAQAIVDTM